MFTGASGSGNLMKGSATAAPVTVRVTAVGRGDFRAVGVRSVSPC